MLYIETFVQDARYAIRTLLRTPAFTLAAVSTLTLGIGANSAIFGVVNAVLLRPLPFPEADRLVSLVRRYPAEDSDRQTGRRYLFFRDHLRSVEALAAYRPAGSFNLISGDRAEFVNAMEVSKEYFRVFRAYPAVGQAFDAEHDRLGGPDVAILTHQFWRRHFGEDRHVLGTTILIADRAHTIIGVMPASFTALSPVDVLLPLRPGTTGPGGGYNYGVAGRLRDGVTREQAAADAAIVWEAFRAEFGDGPVRNELPGGFAGMQENLSRPLKPALLVMLAAVGLLLLIACANTANLLLARAAHRGREVAVRAALGAGRGRLVRQMLTESVTLAVLGGAGGLLLAYITVPALLALAPPGFLITPDVRVDGTVLAITMAIAVTTGLIFGIAPALSLSSGDLVSAFKHDGSRTTGSKKAGWLRRSLVVAQVALCMLLLVGAGLLVQTFARLRAVDPGFDPRGVLTARMSMQGERYSTPEAVNRFYAEGLERIRRIPGVRSAAVVSGVPIERGLNLNVDVIDGPHEDRVENALTDWRYAAADYFTAMGIPIVAGRGFTDTDRAGAPPVAVVSEEFARRFFKTSGAIGRHIRVFDADGSIEIVGVAKDVKEAGLKGPVIPVMYVPIAQTHARAITTTHGYFHVSWVVRSDNPGAALSRQIAEEIREVDPRQPFAAFRTMEEVKARAILQERFQMTLLGAFALIGLLLATAGIYGLTAYSVAQRTREFGIRMALGASRESILGSVLRQAAVLAAAGVLVGVAAAAACTRVLANFVWGVSTLDAATFALVAVLLVSIAILASVVPAWRAVRLNPVAALRE